MNFLEVLGKKNYYWYLPKKKKNPSKTLQRFTDSMIGLSISVYKEGGTNLALVLLTFE
jgi:hypothetical protein